MVLYPAPRVSRSQALHCLPIFACFFFNLVSCQLLLASYKSGSHSRHVDKTSQPRIVLSPHLFAPFIQTEIQHCYHLCCRLREGMKMTPITPWQCLHRIARRNRGWVKEALDGAAAGAINKASTSACVGTAGATRAGDKDSFKPNILHFLEENLAHRVLRDHPSEKGLKKKSHGCVTSQKQTVLCLLLYLQLNSDCGVSIPTVAVLLRGMLQRWKSERAVIRPADWNQCHALWGQDQKQWWSIKFPEMLVRGQRNYSHVLCQLKARPTVGWRMAFIQTPVDFQI